MADSDGREGKFEAFLEAKVVLPCFLQAPVSIRQLLVEMQVRAWLGGGCESNSNVKYWLAPCRIEMDTWNEDAFFWAFPTILGIWTVD